MGLGMKSTTAQNMVRAVCGVLSLAIFALITWLMSHALRFPDMFGLNCLVACVLGVFGMLTAWIAVAGGKATRGGGKATRAGGKAARLDRLGVATLCTLLGGGGGALVGAILLQVLVPDANLAFVGGFIMGGLAGLVLGGCLGAAVPLPGPQR